MLRSSNHSLWHVSVLDRNNPRCTLALLDKSSATLESTVGHAHLLSSIEDDSDAVAFSDILSATRVGLFSQRLSLALGDWNTDDVPDLFIGWALEDPFIVNLRVLFGGTR